jgi:hypothetical protein
MQSTSNWGKIWSVLISGNFTFQNIEDKDIQNTFASYTSGCEKFLTLRGEHKLQVSGKKIRKIFDLMRDEVTEQLRILHSEELCNLYRSASIVGARVAQSV